MSAKIADLCHEDKQKVATLIQQVVKLGSERDAAVAEADAERKAAEQKIEQLKHQNDRIVRELVALRHKFSQSLEVLKAYQARMLEMEAPARRERPSLQLSGPDVIDITGEAPARPRARFDVAFASAVTVSEPPAPRPSSRLDISTASIVSVSGEGDKGWRVGPPGHGSPSRFPQPPLPVVIDDSMLLSESSPSYSKSSASSPARARAGSGGEEEEEEDREREFEEEEEEEEVEEGVRWPARSRRYQEELEHLMADDGQGTLSLGLFEPGLFDLISQLEDALPPPQPRRRQYG